MHNSTDRKITKEKKLSWKLMPKLFDKENTDKSLLDNMGFGLLQILNYNCITLFAQSTIILH